MKTYIHVHTHTKHLYETFIAAFSTTAKSWKRASVPHQIVRTILQGFFHRKNQCSHGGILLNDNKEGFTQKYGWASQPLCWAKEGRFTRLWFHLCDVLDQTKITKSEKNQTGGCLWMTRRRHEGTFWGDENVLHCDRDAGYVRVFNCQIYTVDVCVF